MHAMMNSMASSCILSLSEQEKFIEKHEIFDVQGFDKRGRIILRIIGKLFPARLVSVEAFNKYMQEKVFPRIGERPFSVVYLHTGVRRGENFPGILALRSIYEATPINVKDHLKAVYFVHPGLRSRLFLATFGPLLFSGGLYWKVKYVNRLEFLWNYVKRKEMEIPEYVYDHDEDLEYYRPMGDYCLESDHPELTVHPRWTLGFPRTP